MSEESHEIRRAQAGDSEALNALMTRYWQPIYRFIVYKTGNSEDAQELTQETFLRAFRALPTFQPTDAAFKTYLSRIAINLITDFWRKGSRQPAGVPLEEHTELAAAEESPEETVIGNEQQALITEKLSLLPQEQRQTIEMRIIAGWSVKETAAALNKSEAAVKMLQQRALKTLRSLLLAEGVIEEY